MSGWMSWFGGRRDTREQARDSIVKLRQQLLMIEKKEEHLQKKIEDETSKARANATSNKRVAMNALRQKKAFENELDRLAGTRMTLETQVNAIESANLNAETMVAMRQGAAALQSIHSGLKVDKVDETMDHIREQMELTNEISDAISNPVGMGVQLDEDDLQAELDALEQEELDSRLAGADHVPVHTPASPVAVNKSKTANKEEDDEEAQLRQLQAELAM
ncbi:Snf7-domain-containing protein [Cutaneotrichosporon oleaginosum]|uniref:Vacuolar-sorting protein SNF7 n=1 Tax=Cutaneotrichosporon oleaginosum TaxID=879819 RepID=A0A0J0XBT0_9TREE|nr:Snf7-domain-containing protein [Cutaneotrichosporon oleaginosum]KLT38521.1 Snf7-domain-containing protein [Cutaneotrichosporon oleaginosum]TXT14700.1 hypothetical protein COLE_00893 [Cutaneotrichosporon oleaginosum]